MSAPISTSPLSVASSVQDIYGKYKVAYWIKGMPSLKIKRFATHESAIGYIKTLYNRDEYCIVNKKWNHYEVWTHDGYQWNSKIIYNSLSQSLNELPVNFPSHWLN